MRRCVSISSRMLSIPKRSIIPQITLDMSIGNCPESLGAFHFFDGMLIAMAGWRPAMARHHQHHRDQDGHCINTEFYGQQHENTFSEKQNCICMQNRMQIYKKPKMVKKSPIASGTADMRWGDFGQFGHLMFHRCGTEGVLVNFRDNVLRI